MKPEIHPTFYPQATVICSCGNTWKTGSTVEEIRTEICSQCHPFYTGEQRIVDTEGQVERFYKKLEAREQHIVDTVTRKAELTSPELAISELDLGARAAAALEKAGVHTAGDVLERLARGGDSAMLEIQGFGQKGLIDLKKRMRARGFDLLEAEAA